MTSHDPQRAADVPNAPPVTWPWEGHPYSIKRHGVTLTNCDSEPVQTPGCVQAHGVLLVLRPDALTIAQASDNTLAVLGQAAQLLLEQPIALVVGTQRAEQLRAFLQVEPIDRNPLYVFSLPGPDGRELDVTVHIHDGVVLLEFEATRHGSASEPGELDFYALVKKTVARLQGAASLQDFCDITADEVRALTGLDRVMIYRFHADGHGEVFAESRADHIAPWLGLHYPASDIPQPAREIFKRIWVRPTPDVGGALAEMVPLTHPDSALPLDMTYCALRGASVMYTEYLQNMKVTAGLTMPIRRGEDLWGLIACHHYNAPRHLPYQVRAACEFLAQVASLQQQAAENREHLRYRMRLESVHQQLIGAAARSGELATLAVGSPTLLDGINAGGAAIFHAQRWWLVGTTPTPAQLDALAHWLKGRAEFNAATHAQYATDHLAADFPPAADYADVAAGVLALPLARQHRSLMMWFRPETISTVDWGGNPHDKPTVVGPHGPRLTPRASFELFTESVRDRSLPWEPVEIESLTRLRVLVMELVVERAERMAELNAELHRSNEELDAFAYVASHDLKEPLRGIQNYAHQLLEDATQADAKQRLRLDGLVRLARRMDSLLDSLFQFARVGRTLLEPELCDLNLIVAEAIDMVSTRIEETATTLVCPRALPSVQCDWIRCREIYLNLLSNALKYNDKSERCVEVGWLEPDQAHPGAPAHTAGQPVFYVRDNGIGIDAKQYEQVFKMFKRLHGRDEYGGGAGAGLSIVQKLVDRHNGRIWVDSVPGVGSTFYFTLSADAKAAG